MMHQTAPSTLTTALRGVFGGVLMGLANLVPGISGGTMLLAAGVYPPFIRGVAEVSTFRFRLPSLVLLSSVVGGAVIAIVALAGVMRDLVVDHRWIAYSLFIGLTLGGVPLLWRMIRPVTSTAVVAAVAGIAAMVALALAQAGHAGEVSGDPQRRLALLVLAGIAGGAAMILPGVSGGYLLLVLGQYVVILSAIDGAREAAGGGDWAALGECLKVFVPVGVGVVIGVVGVSNLVKLCLDRFPQATLGVLLGLLLGAVAGLWPFQEAVEAAGQGVAGDPPTVTFRPSVLQAAASLGLVAAGFGLSTAVTRVGRNAESGAGSGR